MKGCSVQSVVLNKNGISIPSTDTPGTEDGTHWPAWSAGAVPSGHRPDRQAQPAQGLFPLNRISPPSAPRVPQPEARVW